MSFDDLADLYARSAAAPGAVGRPKDGGARGRARGIMDPSQEGSIPSASIIRVRRDRAGAIWNVYEGPRYMGIVNERSWIKATEAALREWPDRPRIRVLLATDDPFRLRTMVRPEFVPPIVTTRVQ